MDINKELINIDRESLGNKIKKRRAELNLTQENLADKIEKDISHVGNIERGSSVPSLQMLVDICNTLFITPNEVLIDSIISVNDFNEKKLRLKSEILKYIDEIPLHQRENFLTILKTFVITCKTLQNDEK